MARSQARLATRSELTRTRYGASWPFALVGAVLRHVRSRGVDRKSRDQVQTGAIDPLRKWLALRASAMDLRIIPRPLWMPDDYLRSIEPLIAIVLGCMRWKSAKAHEVRR